MRVTTSYMGTRMEGKSDLFYLLTESYIEQNKRIMDSFEPLLIEFSRDLGTKGALVRPYSGDERTTLNDVLKKGWNDKQIMRMRYNLPAILITDVDFDIFDARNCNYLGIFLRDLIDEYGNVKVFQLKELLNQLAAGTWIQYFP